MVRPFPDFQGDTHWVKARWPVPQRHLRLSLSWLAHAALLWLLWGFGLSVISGAFVAAQAQPVCTGTVMNISNACLWLKADNGAGTIGGTVSTWQDQSGSSKDLTGRNSPSIIAGSATTGLNFNPVVRFNGTNQRVDRSDSTIGTSTGVANVFFVNRENARVNGTFFGHRLFSNWPDFRFNLHWPWSDGNLYWDHGFGPTGRSVVAANFAATVPNLGFVFNSTNLADQTAGIMVNGQTRQSMAASTLSLLTSTYLGGDTLGSGYANTDVPELLEFKAHLSEQQRNRVQSYLALKYGLTLVRGELFNNAYTSGSDASVFADGTNTYWNRIFGLGRDTVTTLDQRVARSQQTLAGPNLVSSNAPLTVATTADFTSANGGTRTALTDGQYLVLGDDNGAMNTLVGSALGMGNNRIPRVWLVRNTGTVGGVFLGFATTDLDTNFPSGKRGYLLVSSDANFSAATTTRYPLNRVTLNGSDFFTPVTTVGGTTPAAVTIPDGSYVSLGHEPNCTGTVLGVSDACVWLRADTGVSNGSNWNDQSGSNNHANPVNAPVVNNNSVNFNPALEYSGGSGHTMAPAADVTNTYTFFGTAQMMGSSNQRVFSAVNVSTQAENNRLFGYWGGRQDQWFDQGWKTPYLSGAGASTVAKQYTLRRNANTTADLRGDGVLVRSVAISATGLYRVALATGDPYPTESSNVRVPEFLSFKRSLTNTEAERIESYLALKYGITMGTSAAPVSYRNVAGTVYWTPSNTAYHNNVFGLGRDDSSTLHQRVSKSTNSGSILTLATGADFSSANTNSRTGLTNGQFLVLGDNNAAVNSLTGTALGGVNNRLARVWLAQRTGAVPDVFLGFDPASLDALFPAGKRGNLLVSTDASFSVATTTLYPLNRVTVAGSDVFTPVAAAGSTTPIAVPIPNGAYISLGLPPGCDATVMGISDACVWLRADVGVSTGSTWVDQSSAGHIATVRLSPTLSANAINFNPAVSYSGGSGHTLPAQVDVTDQYTFFGMARMLGTRNQRVFSDLLNNRLFGYWNGQQDNWFDQTGWLVGPAPGATTTLPQLYSLRRNATSSASLRGNGRNILTTALSTTGSYRMTLGYGPYSNIITSEYSDVQVPEFLSFQRSLSATETDRVESYLAIKYGLTLGTSAAPVSYKNGSDAVVWTSAANSYHNRVFGLGRDSTTSLDQRVSKSSNSGAVLTLATTADFSSVNNSAARTALSTGQYLMLGDNNGAVNTLNSPALGRVNNRIARVWKAQNTGSVANTFVALDQAAVPLTSALPRYMLVESGAGADGTFPVQRTQVYLLSNSVSGLSNFWVPVANSSSTTALAVTIPNDAFISFGVIPPRITLTKQSRDTVGTFSFSSSNGFVTSSVTTTTAMQPVQVSNPGQTLTARGVDMVFTETMPASGGWSIEAVNCHDTEAANNGNVTGAVIGQITASNQFTILATHIRDRSDLVCTVVNRKGSTLNTISGRVFTDTGVSSGTANDGVINGGESGLANIPLRLSNCSGTVLANTTSAADGSYQLAVPSGTANGNLCVVPTLGASATPTRAGVAVAGSSFNRSTATLTLPFAGTSISNAHVGAVPVARLLQDNARTSIAGSTISFAHTFVAGTAGTVTFTTTTGQSSPAASGWSEVIYRDADCNASLNTASGDSSQGSSYSLAVAANQTICLLVQQFIPAGLADGASRQFQVKADLQWANLTTVTESVSRQDSTQVGNAGLQLIKEVRNVSSDGAGPENWSVSNNAKSGETLEYRITFTNVSPKAINNLVINDATPSYTQYVQAACPSSLPAGLSCSTPSASASPSATAPTVGGGGGIRWLFGGSLPAGAGATVRYRVTVE